MPKTYQADVKEYQDENEQGFGNTCQATLKDSTRITAANADEVRELVLSVDEPAFLAVPGQNIGVLIPGPHPFGNPYHHRYYSVASARPNGEGMELDVLVRRCSYIDNRLVTEGRWAELVY